MALPGVPDGIAIPLNRTTSAVATAVVKQTPKPVPRPSSNAASDASAGLSGSTFQEQFDKRTLNFPLLKGELQRGFMFQKDDQLGGQKPLGLKFLYNPEKVNLSYSINQDIYPPYAQPKTGQPDNSGILAGVPGSATLAFSLVFDRTYECWGPRGTSFASRYGVRTDVLQLEKMLGYSEANPFVTIVGMFVYFGHDRMRYYGYVTGFDVEYGFWTQDMRPSRCAVNIAMQILPYDSAGGGNKASDYAHGATTDGSTTGTPAPTTEGNGRATPQPAPTP